MQTVELMKKPKIKPESFHIVRYGTAFISCDYSQAFLFGGVLMKKGSKHSPMTILKLKLSHIGQKSHFKGKHHSEESKEKLRNIFKGKPLSKEHKRKIGLASKGRRHSKENRKRLSELMIGKVGELHPAWKGGISSEPYCFIWFDKEFKEYIKERDNCECQSPKCWGTGSYLTIHHINYVKKDCVPANLITLCNSCNSRANQNRKIWQRIFKRVMINNGHIKEPI